jgi:hypothetical protein
VNFLIIIIMAIVHLIYQLKTRLCGSWPCCLQRVKNRKKRCLLWEVQYTELDSAAGRCVFSRYLRLWTVPKIIFRQFTATYHRQKALDLPFCSVPSQKHCCPQCKERRSLIISELTYLRKILTPVKSALRRFHLACRWVAYTNTENASYQVICHKSYP